MANIKPGPGNANLSSAGDDISLLTHPEKVILWPGFIDQRNAQSTS
ncbi:MAG: hypothetical protein MJK10_10380 [Pseudomonadales bacterium]|nr:hypothetical protein [Pseudomonadales bacterium]NRA16002.1 hypothetical protein [Oceanospirillaceae bacterium]